MHENNYSKQIMVVIKGLAEKSIFPSLNDNRLFNFLESGVDVVKFILNNSILSNTHDIFSILKTKLDQLNSLTYDSKLLEIYDSIFEEFVALNSRVLVFSGGTGSNSLVKGLLKAGADVTILINAYDDGKSTGDIRRKFGILGPSDIAKNLVALMDDSKKELKRIFEYRLPQSENPEYLKNYLKSICADEESNPLTKLLMSVNSELRNLLKLFLNQFNQEMFFLEKKNGEFFDLRDYGLRNIIYTGAYFYYNKDHQYTINKLIELFDLPGKILLNSEENLFLIAVTENGILLNSESSIITDNLDEEIAEIFLVKKQLSPEEIKKFYYFNNLSDKLNFLKESFAIYPEGSKPALNAIENSNLILFAPTTFYSSLVPTLLTKGIPEAINRSNTLKICIANLIRERGHHTLGENLEKLENYINHTIKNHKNKLDYLVVNTHGYRTDGVVNTCRLPVDEKSVFQQGVQLIEVNAEDLNDVGKHQQELIVQIIQSLKKIDDLGYKINQRALVKSEEIDSIEEKKVYLKQLLSNPFLYAINENRIKRLLAEILDLDKIESFKPIRPVKVVILGAGKATRLDSNIPKIIYPIDGKANIAYLLEKYSELDDEPLVVINEFDKDNIKNWLSNNPKYKCKLCVAKDLRGTAMTFFDVLKHELTGFEGDIFLSWGDITNIKSETIRLTVALHQAIRTAAMTIPTCWERNPYAGLVRNIEGSVCDVFLTKENPDQKRALGEHDASVFIMTAKEINVILPKIIHDSGIENNEVNELNFLKAIPKLYNKGKEILGVCCADVRECFGFNTKEDVDLVVKYKTELEEKKISGSKMIDINIEENNFNEQPEVKYEKEKIKEDHSNKLAKNINRVYKGLLVDVDDTLTNEKGDIPNEMLNFLVKLSNSGIPVGIVTGRTNKSLSNKLLSLLQNHLGFTGQINIYVYPENGSYCYRFDQQEHNKLYDTAVPFYMLDTAITFIRKKVLKFGDNYSVTKNKIHIWPKDPSNQRVYLKKTNQLFKSLNLPLIAYKSNSLETSGSILISSVEANKGKALNHFAKANNCSINELAKIGDMADENSVDHSLLNGDGSFSVNEFDPKSSHQVGLVLCKGKEYKGVNGTKWLLNNLKFNIPPQGI